MPLPLISAHAAVGVEQHHLAVGTVAPGDDDDQPVGTDAPVPVAERGARRRGRRYGHAARTEPATSTRKSLPVAWSFARSDGRSSAHPALPGGRAARRSGFPAAPIQVMRGSRRNHIRWRRANCAGAARPCVAAPRRATGTSPSRWASDLLVPDRLAGGARQPAACAPAPRTSSTSPASRIAATRAVDAVGASTAARQPHARPSRTGTTVSPYVVRARARTTRTAGR